MEFLKEIWNYVIVFAVGGALCVIAQILIDKTKLTPARILVAYVTAGVILGAVGIYEPFAKFAGAGATTPLLGFGNTIAKGIRKEIDSRGLIGALTGGLTAASAGIAAAMVFGYLAALIFSGKKKS